MNSPKGYYMASGKAPSGSGERDFKVSQKHLAHLLTFGPAYKYYEIQSVVEAIKDPILIFQGLKRDGHEGSFCYIGRPRIYGENWTGPSRPDMVFLVCLTQDFTIFEWRWEKEDKNNAGFPLDSAARFGKAIWKHS